jgi:hypothetical protein
MRARVLTVSIFDTLFVFGLIVFLYVVGVSYFQPFWLSREAFHFQVGIWWLSGLRNDDMGIVAFVVSFVSFLCGRYLRNRRHPPEWTRKKSLDSPEILRKISLVGFAAH